MYFAFFQSKLDKIPSEQLNCSFSTLLSQSMALGAKTVQGLMNSDTQLYSSFCTCTNESFRCISHSFIQNCIKFLRFIFHPLNNAVFRCCYSMDPGAKNGQRLMNSDRNTHLCSSFFTCTNVSLGCLSNSFIQNCIKCLQFMFHPLNIAVFRRSCRSLWLWELKLAKD